MQLVASMDVNATLYRADTRVQECRKVLYNTNLFPGLRKSERVGLGSHVHTFFQKSWETMHVTPVHVLPQCILVLLVQIGDGVQL